MFKRSNKITPLLVAAATVISLVPTSVSAAEVKKIESKDGTIYNAVSFSNGSCYIDGEINDDVKETILDNAGEALRKNIKKDTEDRYQDSTSLKTYEAGQIIRRSGNYFLTTYTANTGKTKGGSTINGIGNQFSVYFNINGNYIDADYNLGKIKVTTTSAGGNITTSQATIENTDDDYDITSGGTISANLSDIKIIDHDVNNVYRFATITVTASDVNTEISKINGKSVASVSDVFKYVFISKRLPYELNSLFL